MIVAVAIVIAPATIAGDTGTFKFIVNVSSPSTMSSSTTAMFTVLLLVPAVITAVCMSELKSGFFPEATNYYTFIYKHVYAITEIIHILNFYRNNFNFWALLDIIYTYGTAQRQRRTRCSSRARCALALDSSLQACN